MSAPIRENPVQIETRIGDDLLEHAVDDDRLVDAIERERDDLRAIREKLQSSPNELDRTRLGRVLNRLGEHLTLSGEYSTARQHLEEAAAIWREFGRPRARFLARVRAAEVELARSNLEEAEREADQLVDDAATSPLEIYRDFALELRGRIRAKRGDRRGSHRDLRRCLDLRRDAGRDRLVDRTERLLDRIDRDGS